jgi:microcystin-dependent protein
VVDAFIGEISLFPYDFVPQFWVPCDGRELIVDEHQNLYHLLGDRFGSSGYAPAGNNLMKTFKIPEIESPDPQLQYCMCIQGTFPAKS